MSAYLRERLIQANSPWLLAEEVARFSSQGWRAIGEPFAVVSPDVGRPIYWAQTVRLVAEAPLPPANGA